jgi:REP element-mobilizing transposase RayT
MRLARKNQFDPQQPPWLHCVSRCVRKAFLCGDGFEHRREWIERRLKLLASTFAVDLAAYAILSNHLHIVIKPKPAVAKAWTPRQVVTAWSQITRTGPVHSPNGVTAAEHQADQQAMVDQLAQDEHFIETWRERLSSTSYFMKALKEPIARAANKEDDCTGAFWEGRFKSTPLLDEAALLACMAYVDLNPIRAGIAKTPESSLHTSVQQRIHQRQARQQAKAHLENGKAEWARKRLDHSGMRLKPGQQIVHLSPDRDDQTTTPWLVPVTGILGSFKAEFGLNDYLRLLDSTGRQIRSGKRGSIPADCAAILDRLHCDHDEWLQTMSTPQSLLGAVLGQADARQKEIRRRCRKWFQVRCPLFA